MMDIRSVIFFSPAPKLLILLALLFCIAPSEAQAPGQLTGSTIDWDEIYITAPVDISGWPLVQGITNERNETLNVDATGSWEVRMKDADSTTSGNMTKYNIRTGEYDTNVTLASPMDISADGGSEVTLTGDYQQICTGSATAQGGQNINITFKQPVSWGDQILESGYRYRIVVTFSGSLTG